MSHDLGSSSSSVHSAHLLQSPAADCVRQTVCRAAASEPLARARPTLCGPRLCKSCTPAAQLSTANMLRGGVAARFPPLKGQSSAYRLWLGDFLPWGRLSVGRWAADREEC